MIERCRIEGFGKLSIEVWHSRDGFRFGNECAAEDADWVGCHRDFDGVVDIYKASQ